MYKDTLYIGGEWQSGKSKIDNINPSDISENIGSFDQASETQVKDAIFLAKKAQAIWQEEPLEKKQTILNNIGNELINRCEELGKLLSREEGKPFLEGKGEIYRAGQFFTYYAGEVLRQEGELYDSVRPGVGIEITKEPIGIVGIISPWNFPTATAAWKIAPALAFGNAVIWKPANLTPASAVEFAKIIDKQDIPKGLFNLILGSGSSVGNKLIQSSEINAISFTGSVETGKKVALETSKNFVKCQLEMGSKNALIVADDANMDIAIASTIAGSYSGAGQKCTASSRLLVFDKVYDEFVSKLSKKIKEIKVGHALDEGIFMGPVIDETQLNSNLSWVKKAKAKGADIICGGKKLNLKHDGYYMEPTLIINTENSWDINQEEVFAPLACVIRVKNLEEAILVSNDTRYGLTSGIITQSLKNASIFKQQSKSGCVMVNLPTAGTDYHVPFGGRKNSSFGGREQGKYARDFFTIVKTAYQKPY